jgi:putative ABC transport system permease protein
MKVDIIMFKSYFKIAIRNLLRNKVHSFINIFGLAIAITAVILILLYIKFEYSYDNFHGKKERIFRVSVKSYHNKILDAESYVFVPPIGPAMKNDIPEIEEYTRISTPRISYLTYSKKTIKVDNVIYADSTFFGIFDFKLNIGDKRKSLAEPYSIILTKETAEKFFGNQNPVGEIIVNDNNQPFTITGVMDNPPLNSHIQFNALISFSTFYENPNNYMSWSGGNQYITYVLLKKNTLPSSVNTKLPDLMWKNINESLFAINVIYEAYLQPLKDIHLYYNDYSTARRTTINIFLTLSIFILFIACINFINLSTARAAKRAKEVGVRKVLGAHKKILIEQFLTETILLSLSALIIAVSFVELIMPWYNKLIERQLDISDSFGVEHLAGLIAILIITGIVAGFYPAFKLSSFQPAKTLKGEIIAGKSKFALRNILVVFQFVISVSLISATFLINSQLAYLKGKELGFDNANIVVLPLINDVMQTNSEFFKNELKKIPQVISVTASSHVPSSGFASNGYMPEGFVTPMMIHAADVDEDYLKTFNLQIVRGRNFTKEFSTDKYNYLINETLARQLNGENPIGKTITRNGKHEVIGVVKDFNFASLYEKIEPLIITNQPWRDRYDFISVKIFGGNLNETLGRIENVWNKFTGNIPFEFSFLDESFNWMYKSELKFKEIFFYFSALAIFIALLGLFGLVAYAAEQKTKEIGIRKVLGASFSSIIVLLTKEFLKPVVIANVIAAPIASWFVNLWLQNFAYRIEINWWMFALAGGIALTIALFTLSIQAIKAATANPVKSLRYE